MPIYFLDSSAVIKLYQSENGSQEVNGIVSASDSLAFISRLTVTEVQRAFARKMREGKMTAADLDSLRNLFFRDLLQRRLLLRRLRDFHYRSAERLVRKYAAPQPHPLLRTLDVIQLATALDLRRQPGLDYFVSADEDLCEVAKAEQLSVINPASSTRP
jgi:predicted nucleic acid-binding protein